MSISNSTESFFTPTICANSSCATRVLGCGRVSRQLLSLLLLDTSSICDVTRVDKCLFTELNEIAVFFLLIVAASQSDTPSTCPLCSWFPNVHAPPMCCLCAFIWELCNWYPFLESLKRHIKIQLYFFLPFILL